jgi:hypothetical protein
LAARYHEEALRAEFNVPEDDGPDAAQSPVNWH